MVGCGRAAGPACAWGIAALCCVRARAESQHARRAHGVLERAGKLGAACECADHAHARAAADGRALLFQLQRSHCRWLGFGESAGSAGPAHACAPGSNAARGGGHDCWQRREEPGAGDALQPAGTAGTARTAGPVLHTTLPAVLQLPPLVSRRLHGFPDTAIFFRPPICSEIRKLPARLPRFPPARPLRPTCGGAR